MRLGRSITLIAAVTLMAAFTVSAASATQPAAAANVCRSAIDRSAAVPPAPAGQATVTGVRIGNHENETLRYDRVVVDLTKPLGHYTVQYVPQVIADGSGNPVHLAGKAFLNVRFNAVGHDDNGHGTITTSTDQVADWGSLREVRLVGDFEAVMNFGIGLRASTDFVVSTLTSPNRLVIDVAMPGQHPWRQCRP